MKDGLIVGFALGLVCGALLVNSSHQAKDMVDKGKRAVKKQMQKLKD